MAFVPPFSRPWRVNVVLKSENMEKCDGAANTKELLPWGISREPRYRRQEKSCLTSQSTGKNGLLQLAMPGWELVRQGWHPKRGWKKTHWNTIYEKKNIPGHKCLEFTWNLEGRTLLSFIEYVGMRLLLHSLQLYAKSSWDMNPFSWDAWNSFDLKAHNVSALLRKKKRYQKQS